MERVFVIHGHDLEARDELIKLLRVLDVEWLSFEEVSASLPGSPYVGDVVLEGITRAKAVVALFTPDEQSVLYQPSTSRYLGDQRGGNRWQARPNVIFEAGIAQGIARDRVLIATVGGDVELFSDVGGVHFIRLDANGGKRLFANRLMTILGRTAQAKLDVASSESGDFERVCRVRWAHYDEVAHLELRLGHREVGTQCVNLLEVIRTVAAMKPDIDWSRRQSIELMDLVRDCWPSGLVVSNAAWWFIAYGLLEFQDIDPPWVGRTWRETVERTRIAERALRLLHKWQHARATA